jgi:hypothetical protein
VGPTSGQGSAEPPRERIERFVAEGQMPRDAVEQAERLWQAWLRHGVTMPNGEQVRITLDDLYHIIVDSRIWRHPERIARALESVFEIRALEHGSRLAFSRWYEGEQERLAALVLYPDRTLRTMHLIDERRLRRYTRKVGEVVWRR